MQGEHYDEKIDVYSFGVLLTEFLTRQKPFSDQFKIRSYQDVFDQVLDNDAVPTIPEWSARFIKPLVLSCLSREPSRRPSFNDIILYLSEFLQLDEMDFFLQFDIPRIMHMLDDSKFQFQALGAAELAKLAFNEKFRSDAVVPDWARAGPGKDAAIDGRPYSFRELSQDVMESMLLKLSLLINNKRSLVQLSACRALTCILALLNPKEKQWANGLVTQAGVLRYLCLLFAKESNSLRTAASNLIMSIVSFAPELGTFSGLATEELRVLTGVIKKERSRLQAGHEEKQSTLQTIINVEQSISVSRNTLTGSGRFQLANDIKTGLKAGLGSMKGGIRKPSKMKPNSPISAIAPSTPEQPSGPGQQLQAGPSESRPAQPN